MAVDVCSEVSSLVVSPRISFSHDLREADPAECHGIITRSDALLLESIDFNFCISQSFSQEVLSSADELFANGKILPAEVKKSTSSTVNPEKQAESFRESLRSRPISSRFRKDTAGKSPRTENAEEAAPAPLNFDTKKKSLKEFLSLNLESDAETEAEEDQKKPAAAKPFWQFRRSSSLNFDTCRSTTLIRSLHFLSRSNSTGSAPNPKPKILQKQYSQKDHQPSSAKRTKSSATVPSSSSSSSSSTTNHSFYSSSSNSSSSYRSPSRKNYGNGVRISPVLNIPHACISKGTVSSLFGLGSLFCNGKSSKKKKKYS